MLKRFFRTILPSKLWSFLVQAKYSIRVTCAPPDYGPLRALPLPLWKRRYREVPAPKGFSDESEAREALLRVADHTLMSYERAVTLHQQVKYLEQRGVEGDFVECGVARGGAVGLMALANLRYGQERRDFHLFDSFRGLPEPTVEDGAEVKRRAEALVGRSLGSDANLEPVGWEVTSRRDSAQLLAEIGYPDEHLHYHVGWFQETLPKAQTIERIALLRLDGDWYESTKVCLEALYPRVVVGGFIVVDDYGHYEGCRKAVDEFQESLSPMEYLHHIDYTGRYFVKAHRTRDFGPHGDL